MTTFLFTVKVVSKALGELEAGVLELASPGYEDLMAADGTRAAMREVTSYPEAGMIQFRGVVLPREEWGGLLVTLASKSVAGA